MVAVGWLSLRANKTLATFDFGTDPGPALIPTILLWALGVGSVILLLQGIRLLTRLKRAPAAARPRAAFGKFVWPTLFVASLAIYLRLLFVLGFRIASLAFCTVWILVLALQADRRFTVRHVVVAIATAALITGAIYYVFKAFVKVPLP